MRNVPRQPCSAPQAASGQAPGSRAHRRRADRTGRTEEEVGGGDRGVELFYSAGINGAGEPLGNDAVRLVTLDQLLNYSAESLGTTNAGAP
jgi:hypothetical protein